MAGARSLSPGNIARCNARYARRGDCWHAPLRSSGKPYGACLSLALVARHVAQVVDLRLLRPLVVASLGDLVCEELFLESLSEAIGDSSWRWWLSQLPRCLHPFANMSCPDTKWSTWSWPAGSAPTTSCCVIYLPAALWLAPLWPLRLSAAGDKTQAWGGATNWSLPAICRSARLCSSMQLATTSGLSTRSSTSPQPQAGEIVWRSQSGVSSAGFPPLRKAFGCRALPPLRKKDGSRLMGEGEIVQTYDIEGPVTSIWAL